MKTFLVNIPVEHKGTAVYLAGEIRARSWKEAEQVCEKAGFELLGTFEGEYDCPEVVEAMIEKQYNEVH